MPRLHNNDDKSVNSVSIQEFFGATYVTGRAQVLLGSKWLGPLILTVCLSSVTLAAHAGTGIDAVGPIERASCANGSFRLLGIEFRAASSSVKAAICRWQPGSALRLAIVSAIQDDRGTLIAQKLTELPGDSYVPGVTEIYIRGVVTTIRPEIGEFYISGAKVVSPTGQVP